MGNLAQRERRALDAADGAGVVGIQNEAQIKAAKQAAARAIVTSIRKWVADNPLNIQLQTIPETPDAIAHSAFVMNDPKTGRPVELESWPLILEKPKGPYDAYVTEAAMGTYVEGWNARIAAWAQDLVNGKPIGLRLELLKNSDGSRTTQEFADTYWNSFFKAISTEIGNPWGLGFPAPSVRPGFGGKYSISIQPAQTPEQIAQILLSKAIANGVVAKPAPAANPVTAAPIQNPFLASAAPLQAPAWASEAVDFANKNLGAAASAAFVKNILPLINQASGWSVEQKKLMANLLLAQAYFLMPEQRMAFFSPNLKDADSGKMARHSLVSNLMSADPQDALQYMGMLYQAVSGESNPQPETLRDLSAYANRLRELARDQTNPRDDANGTINPLYANTIDASGRLEFLLYAAPALIYNDGNMNHVRGTLKMLEEMDDLILYQGAGARGVQLFYGAALPAFAYADMYHERMYLEAGQRPGMDALLGYLQALGGNTRNISVKGADAWMDGNRGAFVPVGRGEVQSTPDGYLKLDLLQAINITNVYRVSPQTVNYGMPTLFNAATNWWFMDIPGAPSSAAEGLARYPAIQFLEKNGKLVLADERGVELQSGVIETPYNGTLRDRQWDGRSGGMVYLVGKGVEIKTDAQGRVTNVGDVIGNSGMVASRLSEAEFKVLSGARGYINHHIYSQDGGGSSSSNSSGLDRVQMSGVWTLEGEGITPQTPRIDVEAQFRQNDASSQSTMGTGNSAGTSGTDLYGRVGTRNKLDLLSANLWALYQDITYRASTNRSTGSNDFQLGADLWGRDNRRYGGFNATDLFDTGQRKTSGQREDVLFNPNQFSLNLTPVKVGFNIYQAGLGPASYEKSVPLLNQDDQQSFVRLAGDVGGSAWRLTAGQWMTDPFNRLGFATPAWGTGEPVYDLNNPMYFNRFALTSFGMGGGVSGVASLGQARYLSWYNQVQGQFGLQGADWHGRLLGMFDQAGSNDLLGAEGSAKLGGAHWEASALKSLQSGGIWGARFAVSTPSGGLRELQAALYDRRLGVLNSAQITNRNTPINPFSVEPGAVFKFYAAMRPSRSSQLEVSGIVDKTGTPTGQTGTLSDHQYSEAGFRFVFDETGRFASLVMQQTQNQTTSSGPTTNYTSLRVVGGVRADLNLGGGWTLSGAGVQYNENSVETSITNAAGQNISSSQTPYKWGEASAQAVWHGDASAALVRAGARFYPNVAGADAVGLGIYQFNPYQEVIAEKLSDYFADSYGVGLSSRGVGFWHGVSASLSYIEGRGGYEFYRAQEEARVNVSKNFWGYGYHWKTTDRNWFETRFGVGAGFVAPLFGGGELVGQAQVVDITRDARNIDSHTRQLDVQGSVTYRITFGIK